MARFQLGAEAVLAAATRTGGGAFTPAHKFEAGETKYLQFLTPMEQVATVLMHRFIIVGEREDGSDKFADFIVGSDDESGEPGYDPLKDRFGLTPAKRCIAVAVELEPVWGKQGTKKVLQGWDVVTRQYESDGETKEVPNVALVNESPFTFYGHLVAFSDLEPIEDVVFAIKRTGKSTDTSYTLMRAGDAIEDLGDEEDIAEFFESFDFVEYLENLADEDRMAELIDPLPDDAVVSRFANKGKGKKDAKAEPAQKAKSTRTRRAKPEPEAEVEEESEGEEPEEAPKAARSRRFAQLRTETAKK